MTYRRKSLPPGTAEQGFTLIEMLIAFLVISIGLLGLAGLQGLSKKANYEAYQRTLATHLVDGMIERIKANPTAAASYHTGSGADNVLGGATKTKPDPLCDSDDTCSKAELATLDLWAWEQMIDGAMVQDPDDNSVGGLFKPKGCIMHTVETGKTNSGQVTVILTWGGLIETSDAVQGAETACGGEDAGDDSSRRQVSVSTYLYDQTETSSI